jgi:hypothetical protein
VESGSKRHTEADRRNEAAMEEVRRLFARYRAHPQPPAHGAQRRGSKAPARGAEREVKRPAGINAP